MLRNQGPEKSTGRPVVRLYHTVSEVTVVNGEIHVRSFAGTLTQLESGFNELGDPH